ncbi:unnamed protein product [Closterium sp. NIES-54]
MRHSRAFTAMHSLPCMHCRGVGYPALLPAFNCSEPLDVSNDLTFRLIQGVLTDLRAVFPGPTIHIGGDEVDAGERGGI